MIIIIIIIIIRSKFTDIVHNVSYIIDDVSTTTTDDVGLLRCL